MAERQQVRCAIYTRKSSEEGLEQSFNSLDAQREACFAYIASQRHEGWRPVRTRYDDGGYSGGSLDRPALQMLLADIRDQRVDLVVVYKVDRLTRSLTDFAKIIETLDAHKVSFVSVTQSFNTTTSMGRLTLNVLLSFAQFEREVTGERIRDKIAASKRKGMWMGGLVPLGYERKDRTLVVNDSEASTVRHIFERYIVLRNVRALRGEVTVSGIVSKVRTDVNGRRSGGTAFSRGALYTLLKNRVYRGEIRHGKEAFAGLHPAIVPLPVWDQVNATLDENRTRRREGKQSKAPSLLAGMIFDREGNRLTPSHAIKQGKRYRYYVSSSTKDPLNRLRLPAHEVETFVSERIRGFLNDRKAVHDELGADIDAVVSQRTLAARAAQCATALVSETPTDMRVRLLDLEARFEASEEELVIDLNRVKFRQMVLGEKFGGTHVDANRSTADELESGSAPESQSARLQLTIPIHRHRRGNDVRWVIKREGEVVPKHDVALIKTLARGRRWYEQLTTGRAKSMREIAQRENISERYVSRTIHGALIAPDLIERVIEGRQPTKLTISWLKTPPPFDWNEQRRELGIVNR
jgi:site-specific DNA recombinase